MRLLGNHESIGQHTTLPMRYCIIRLHLLNISNSFVSGDAANNYSLKVFVKVSDIYGAMTTKKFSMTVKPRALDASAFNKLAGTVDGEFESGDLAKGAGL